MSQLDDGPIMLKELQEALGNQLQVIEALRSDHEALRKEFKALQAEVGMLRKSTESKSATSVPSTGSSKSFVADPNVSAVPVTGMGSGKSPVADPNLSAIPVTGKGSGKSSVADSNPKQVSSTSRSTAEHYSRGSAANSRQVEARPKRPLSASSGSQANRPGGLFSLAQPLLQPNTANHATRAKRAQALKAVETALRNGASPHEWQGPSSPLREAVKSHSLDLAKALLHARADPDASDSQGVSLLHLAAFDGEADICRLLLEAGACANVTDCHGQSPLFFAPTRTVCMTLFKSHVDMNAMNLKGQSAVHLAAKAGLGEVLVWMSTRVSRAVLCLRDAHGCLAVDYARQAGVKPEVTAKLEHAARCNSAPHGAARPQSNSRNNDFAPGSNPESFSPGSKSKDFLDISYPQEKLPDSSSTAADAREELEAATIDQIDSTR
eukprot:TRINITY_DN392_c2_g2_i1.p1 TRINITY_DN392_c2_g2~~TRINITY_DN392_c2_g2_i1.p1  ORF type:complete len:438 (-),score=84.23 TRINITY_DN392_c2_g2_i1:534-1847(-)